MHTQAFTIQWHIRGDVGRRSVTAGPFSHVTILLSCVVSSEFKQLVPAHKEHINYLLTYYYELQMFLT